MDKENNSIYKGLESIKFMNADVSEQLYEMRDQHFDSFTDLLKVFPGNTKQRDILIKLDYFEEFGPSGTLLRIAKLYDLYDGKKIIKKDKLNGLPVDLLEKYSTQTEKQYRLTDPDAFLSELCAMVPAVELPIQTRINAQQEYLGYISLTIPEKKNSGYVMKIDAKYSPKITLYRLDTGVTEVYKVQKKMYERNPFSAGSVIKFTFEPRQKSRKDENGNWVKLNEYENWISNYIANFDI